MVILDEPVPFHKLNKKVRIVKIMTILFLNQVPHKSLDCGLQYLLCDSRPTRFLSCSYAIYLFIRAAPRVHTTFGTFSHNWLSNF